MKKMLMLILSALVISVIIFLGYRHFTKVETYTELSYSELKSKIESDGKFVLVREPNLMLDNNSLYENVKFHLYLHLHIL